MPKNTKPQGIVCPNCGSKKVKVELRSAGTTSRTNYYRTGVKKSYFLPAGQKTHQSSRNYKSIAVCQNCGHHWTVETSIDVNSIVYLVIFILVIIFCFRACSIISRVHIPEHELPSDEKEPAIWAAEYTPLSEFDYYIDDDGIHIKECTSRSKTIYVSSVYLYENKELPVVSIEESVAFHSVNSIIISEGITKIDQAAFNGCGVKYLYLPSTLTEFSGFYYFHNGEKLYYGGSKDQWNELYTDDRSRLDFVEIICNASISELIGT